LRHARRVFLHAIDAKLPPPPFPPLPTPRRLRRLLFPPQSSFFYRLVSEPVSLFLLSSSSYGHPPWPGPGHFYICFLHEGQERIVLSPRSWSTFVNLCLVPDGGRGVSSFPEGLSSPSSQWGGPRLRPRTVQWECIRVFLVEAGDGTFFFSLSFFRDRFPWSLLPYPL